MGNIVGEYLFEIKPFEVDFRGKLTLPNIVNLMLNAAGYHASERGFGLKDLQREQHSWVLSRVAIEMRRYPTDDEKIRVETWIEGVLRTFTLRNFAFVTEDGEVIGHARTIWAMIDSQSRRPITLTDTVIKDYICDKECPIEKIQKIPNVTESKVHDTIRIKYSDIDINQHTNSAKYFEHVVDAFSLEDFTGKEITRIEVEYIEECHFNDLITIHKTEIGADDYVVSLCNEEGKSICKSHVRFGANQKK